MMNLSWLGAFQPEWRLFLPLAVIFLFLLRALYMNRNGSKYFVNWPVVGMLPMVIANSHRHLEHLTSILRESKCTFMFKGPWFCGMNHLLTCDPENAKYIFSTNFSNYPKGDEFSEVFDILGDGIFTVDGDSWMVQRKIANSHVNHPRFQSSVADCTRDKVAKVLLPLMTHMMESDKVVDLNDVFLRFTFDTICALLLGVDPGCLAPDFPIVPLATATDHMERILYFRYVVPRILWKLLRWLRVGKEKSTTEATEVINHFIARCIHEKREYLKTHKGENNVKEGPIDLLTPYMDLSMEGAGENSNIFQPTDKFLRDTLLTFLSAGKETTVLAIIWLLWLVTSNPDAEKKILKELREVRALSDPKKHSSSEEEMTVFDAEEINSLIYLHAALCESLRLYPPVTFNQKEAVKADTLPSGHKVQPGMKVIYSLYSAGRMEVIWGEDCLDFKPERWITEKGTIRHEPSYKFIAFHSGPRACLGKSMAFTQVKVVAAAIIYNFRIHVVGDHVPEPKRSILTQMKNNLLVKLKKRNSSINGY